MKKKILVVSNDKLFIKKNKISSNYNDTINIIESLSKKNNLSFISKTSSNVQNFLSKKNIYKKFYKLNILNLRKYADYQVFMISVTPFNFLIYVLLKFYKKKIFGHVYLRSDGHKEYFYKYGKLGKFVYNFMFEAITSDLKIISVSKKLTGLKKKSLLVNPSEIDIRWFKNRKKPNLDMPRLLYLGRIKKEKGIFSLVDILNSTNLNYELKIAGSKKKIFSLNNKISYVKELNSIKSIVKLYDECNIFILPSYTEGAPKVLLESLIRYRPVIIFNNIKHVKKNWNGIFSCKREVNNMYDKINYILGNYNNINKMIRKNKIPTKKEFQAQLSQIVS
tara:strand:+ start:532 stop:1536 length:1005 start_codon:yes stop_codon:yes gene_type:complete